MRQAAVQLLLLPAVALLTTAQEGLGPTDVDALLARVGSRVEQYYGRAQSIMCEETVRLEPLGFDMMWNGNHVRRLVYELRVAWEGSTKDGKAPAASVLRNLVSVDGRPPRKGDEPGCMDPKPVSPEPLAMMLPGRRGDYVFKRAGTRRARSGSTVMLDFKSVAAGPADVRWQDECVSVDLPGRWRGRVWLDEATADVLRLDEQLIGMFDLPVPKRQSRVGASPWMTIERADSSIRYRPVRFQDPEETVMLPESVTTVQVVRDSGAPRLRIRQTLSNYRRFITDVRIVTEPPPR